MMDADTIEALRSAHELCAYLWNNVNDDGSGNVELIAHSERHSEQLSALLNDARTRVFAALEAIERQQGDIGKTGG